jgi:putative selenium metabolism protein SsnA
MTVYRNANVLELDPPRVEIGVDLLVEGGTFAAVGRGVASSAPAGSESVDLGGSWVMPGLVCAHTHAYSALARGITAPIAPSSTFVGQLQNLWWRLDRALDTDAVRSSALVAALDAVACGTTTLVDHHASPSIVRGSLSLLRDSFETVGMRGVLCYEVTDRNGEAEAEAGVEENLAFAREAGRGSLVQACIGAHAPFTLSDRTLERLGAAAAETGRGLHLHVAEDPYDPSEARHRHGCAPLERLDRVGLLGPRTIVAHGVHFGPRDVELLNERDAFLVHNARSNMSNAVGYARRLGEARNAALGTDGIGSDMFVEVQAAFLKATDAALAHPPGHFAGLLANGGELATRACGLPVGRIRAGAAADFVVLDYEPPTPITEDNVAGHLVFGLSSRHVRSVVIAGRRVYTDRRFPFDVREVYAAARDQAARLWERMRSLV